MARSMQHYREELRNQMARLGTAVRGYQAGNTWDIPTVAVCVANLVYSKGQPNSKRGTVSILDHLGQKDDVAFMSSGYVDRDGNLVATYPLVANHYENNQMRFVPLHMSKGWDSRSMEAYSFEAWWGKMPIYKSPGYVILPDGYSEEHRASTLTRSDVILTVRNQDGGAHYDADIKNELYAKLKYEGAGWFLQKSDGTMEPVQGMIEAMVAQIGFELMGSLLTHFPDIPTGIGRQI